MTMQALECPVIQEEEGRPAGSQQLTSPAFLGQLMMTSVEN
jgi:hypothetical protein